MATFIGEDETVDLCETTVLDSLISATLLSSILPILAEKYDDGDITLVEFLEKLLGEDNAIECENLLKAHSIQGINR